ncbi:hypothetical protein TNCV_3825841 [Trichonephila clavipes]|nr:hypothetical protein TNCV_3825841 [Trichonephila clavipes]
MRSISPKKRLLHWKTNSEGLPDLVHLSIWRENTWRDKCPIRQTQIPTLVIKNALWERSTRVLKISSFTLRTKRIFT